MRNLKKILALVLAMVMAFSVMATANAFTDDSKIDETYEEAVEVLSGLKVFEGFEDGSFQPKGNITRAQVAAIIYRVVTGDVDDEQVGIYADYNKFTDVKSTSWYAGYVNFCANAEYIKGYGNGKFGPNDQVTGYQALAMILRAIGYDKNGEFTGANWQIQTAAVGKKLGVTDNVSAGTLNTAATREVVAEILFQTIATAPQVEYTVAFGYQSISLSNGRTNTLGYDTFGLACGDRTIIDNWGRPGYCWYASKVTTKAIAVIEEDALYTTHVAETQCDIAKAVSQKADKTYDLYDNSAVKTGTQKIAVLATTAKVGAQGQILEVYKDRIILIDTLLAKVVNVVDAAYDANGHLATPSKIELAVYVSDNARDTDTNAGVTVYDSNGSTNYPYSEGDYVLINAHATDNGVVTSWNKYVEYMEILSVASSIEGAQTVIWYNNGQHTVNGTTYDDADRFHLNVDTTSTANRTWFFDQFGNLIGNAPIATQYNYAVVKNLWWTPDYTNGTGYAQATLVYMDGTENNVTVSSVATYNNYGIEGGAVVTKAATPVYSGYYNSSTDMKFGTVGTTKVLYVASNAYTNAVADTEGVIVDNLFRVETNSDGSVKLAEVDTELTGAKITSKYAVVSGAASKANTGSSVLVNADTQFLVYNTTTQTFSVVEGFNAIENFTKNTVVVDYVMSGNYAKYVYVIGTPDTATTYNFVMPQSINYSAQLKSGDVSYYVITIVNVDGTQTTLNVKVADFSKVLTTLTNGVNKLFYVTFSGSYATDVTEVTEIGKNYTGMDADQRISLLTDDATTSNVVTLTGKDLAKGIYHFNITEATEIVGTLTEGRQTAKNIYVLSNSKDNTALKVWVVAGTDETTSVGVRPVIGVTLTGKNATPAVGGDPDAIVYTANPVYGTSDSNATCTVAQASVQWQKVDANGYFQDWNGDAFVAGTYRAVVTFVISSVNPGTHSEPAVATTVLKATSVNYTID